MTQMAMVTHEFGRRQVEALAGVIAGFIAPGYADGTAVPARVMAPCIEAADQALAHVAATVAPEHRTPKRK